MKRLLEPCGRGHFMADVWNLEKLHIGKSLRAKSFLEDDVSVRSVEVLIGSHQYVAGGALCEFEDGIIWDVLGRVSFPSVGGGEVGIEVHSHERDTSTEHVGPRDTEHACYAAASGESSGVDAASVDVELFADFGIDGDCHSQAIEDVTRVTAAVCAGEDDLFFGEYFEPLFGKAG